jgi:hypothetical protein
MSEETLADESLNELNSIEKYIEVLLNKFPNSITQTELAKESLVTKPAISKIRDKLVPLCDLKVLGYKKKLLLSSDSETLFKLIFFFFSRMKLHVILGSNYLKFLIKKMNIHEELSKSLENLSYTDFFDEQDTNIFLKILLFNLPKIKPPRFVIDSDLSKSKLDEEGLMVRFIAYFRNLDDIKSNFEIFVFDNEDELINLLRLRDKTYYFVRHNLEKALQNWEVVVEIKNEDKKNVYIEAYLTAIDYYALKIVNQLTEIMVTSAENKGVDFKKQYYAVGSLFKSIDNKTPSQDSVNLSKASLVEKST